MKTLTAFLLAITFMAGIAYAEIVIPLPMDTRGSDMTVPLFVDPLNDDLCASFSADLSEFMDELDKCNAGGEDEAEDEGESEAA